MQDRFAEEEVQQRGVVSLDDEEEHFFEWDAEEGGPEDGIGRVGPDAGVDEVAVPGDCGDDGDGEEEEGLVEVEGGVERVVEEGEERGRGEGVGEVAVGC